MWIQGFFVAHGVPVTTAVLQLFRVRCTYIVGSSIYIGKCTTAVKCCITNAATFSVEFSVLKSKNPIPLHLSPLKRDFSSPTTSGTPMIFRVSEFPADYTSVRVGVSLQRLHCARGYLAHPPPHAPGPCDLLAIRQRDAYSSTVYSTVQTTTQRGGRIAPSGTSARSKLVAASTRINTYSSVRIVVVPQRQFRHQPAR